MALVTGASAGIGTAFSRRLAAEGYDVVLVARAADRLRALAQELAAASDADCEVLAADLTGDGLTAVEARLSGPGASSGTEGRPVDFLVNCAGFGTFGSFAELPVDDEEREIRLNIVALVRLTHAALPGMRERHGGRIVNVSSLASFQPGPYFATYAATKAFVLSFSQAVHEEVQGDGVTVTALCPGFTRTEFQERAGAPEGAPPDMMWMTADAVAEAGVAAARRGSALCIPGWYNHATAEVSRRMPFRLNRRVMSLLARRSRR